VCGQEKELKARLSKRLIPRCTLSFLEMKEIEIELILISYVLGVVVMM
jgi:hypothetical protein